MAQAVRDPSGFSPDVPLSSLFRDPVVRDAFRRAERDQGEAFAVTAPREPVLTGGAQQAREAAYA